MRPRSEIPKVKFEAGVCSCPRVSPVLCILLRADAAGLYLSQEEGERDPCDCDCHEEDA